MIENTPPNNNDPSEQMHDNLSQIGEVSSSNSSEGLSRLDRFRMEIGELSVEEALERAKNRSETPQQHAFEGESVDDDVAFKTYLQEMAAKYLDDAPRVVYHPGSGGHVSAAEAFPGARTIFSDVDGDVESAFLQHNIHVASGKKDKPYEFYRADMHTFRLPDDVRADLVIEINTQYFTEGELNAVVRVGGIVIEADTREGDVWGHDATSRIKDFKNYTLLKTSALDNEVFFVYKRTQE